MCVHSPWPSSPRAAHQPRPGHSIASGPGVLGFVLGTLKPWSTASSLTGMHSEDLPNPISTGQA